MSEDLVNNAMQRSAREDQKDLEAVEDRAGEPTLSYKTLLKELETH